MSSAMTLAAPAQATDETCSADSASPSPEVLAVVYDYGHLIAAFRDRANELKIARSHENTSTVFGFTSGYFQKLLAPKPPRRIGLETLGPMLGVLGAKLLLVVDDVALARLAAIGAKRPDMKLVERNSNLVHDGVIQSTRRFLKRIAASGGNARASKLAAYQRQAIARKGGKARWASQRFSGNAFAKRAGR
jgi:hypothetical protein